MASPTSSRNRSTRRSNRPVTQGENPQRSNRQRTSNANVTQGGSRAGGRSPGGVRVTNSAQRTNTGSARVTSSGQSRPALPPGQRGGALARPVGSRSTLNGKPVTWNGTRWIPQGPVRPPAGNSRANAPSANARGGLVMPNSSQEGRNLPRQGARSLRSVTQGPNLRGARPSSPASTSPLGSRVIRGGIATAVVGSLLNLPEEIRKGVNLVRDPGGTIQRATRDILAGRTVDTSPVSRPNTRTNRPQPPRASSERQGPPVPERLRTAPAAPQLPSANDGQAARLNTQRRSSGGSTGAPASRQSPARPSQAQPRTSTGAVAARPGSRWEDFNKGRGTSETNNPLITKNSWLSSKIKEREERAAANVGPVRDGAEYQASRQAAEITARRKKKEEEDKKKLAQS